MYINNIISGISILLCNYVYFIPNVVKDCVVNKTCIPGYIGSSSFLLQVKKVIQDLKTVNPNMIYGVYSDNLW